MSRLQACLEACHDAIRVWRFHENPNVRNLSKEKQGDNSQSFVCLTPSVK